MPVVGRSLIFTPIWIRAWKTNMDIKPINDSFMNSSSASITLFTTLTAIKIKTAIIKNIKTVPNYSDITAMI